MQVYELLSRPKVLLYVTQIMSLFGLGIVARARIARDPKIGKPFYIARDSGGLKPVLFAAQAGLLISALTLDGFPILFSIMALHGAALLTWLAPGTNDRACGESGVFRGWNGYRFEQLESWRLTGEHLRFRVLGEWRAVEVPADRRARLRAILEREIPERESDFKQ